MFTHTSWACHSCLELLEPFVMNFSPSASFFCHSQVGLKVCGITSSTDAEALVKVGVEALGVNFWPQSRRYCSESTATPWLKALAGQVMRVGVFVNAAPEQPRRLIEEGIIDMAQFHGDETPEYCLEFAREALPFIKAFGVKDVLSLRNVAHFHADAVLLDAPAPGAYGGTGSVFDWNLADLFVRRHGQLPVLLAGGLCVENIREAAELVRPAYVDVASGSESAPGIKDIERCRALHEIVSGISRSRDGEADELNYLFSKP